MFQVTEELRREIEAIQYKCILSLGLNPESIIKRNTGEEVIGRKKKRISLKEAYSQLESFYLLIPEHPYDTSFEFFEFMHRCHVTKYDNPPFLQRFTNIIPLCHEMFIDGDATKRKNIVVTSLPFLNINGVCIKPDADNGVVFLNEGLLSAISTVYRFLLPLCEPSIFEGGQKNNNLNRVLDIITRSCLFNDENNDIRDSEHFKYPHANEKWHFRSMLEKSVREDAKKINSSKDKDKEQGASSFSAPPSSLPFSKQMAHFLGCRGAFVFLLGHEFSHIYNDHLEIKERGDIILRNSGQLNSFRKEFKDDLLKYEGIPIKETNFCIHQPLEEEADAHGLQCVINYCVDNKLDDQRTICVVIGAIATFVVMEIYERVCTIKSLGSKLSNEYFSINPFIRNYLFREEHPSPITRLFMLLQHEQFQNHPWMENLFTLNDGLTQLISLISIEISEKSSELEEFLKPWSLPDLDINELFHHQLNLGANDLSQKYLEKIKNTLSNRKK